MIQEIDDVEESYQFVIITEHEDDSYNGQYFRGNDWYDHPHFVMGDQHLFYLPIDEESGWWQLDDRDQEVEGFDDYYNGGYSYGFIGEISELNDCIYFAYTDVCFEFNGEIAVEDPSLSGLPYLTITGHSDDTFNGIYYQAEDWNSLPHYTKSDRSAHWYYYINGEMDDGYVNFWQLDSREQDGTNDWYDGGYYGIQYPWDLDEEFEDGTEVLHWSTDDYIVVSIDMNQQLSNT